MDAFTLQVVNIAVALVMTITMAGLLLATPKDQSLLHWFFAAMSFLAYSALSFSYSPDHWPYWAGPALGNTLLVASYLLLLSGIAMFFQRPYRKRTLTIVLLLIYGANLLPFAQADLLHRVLLNYPLLLLLNLLSLYYLLSKATFETARAALLLNIVLVLNMMQLSLRLTAFLQQQFGAQPILTPEHWFSIGTMAVMLFMLMAMVGCVLLLVRQKTLQLQTLLETDPLTGWLNRHYLEKRLDSEWHRCQREQQPFSVLVFDIDHFKQVNDQHGHTVGDRVLQHITQLARQQLRDYDLLFRMGGEEFVAVLPGVPGANLQQICERLRQHIATAATPAPLSTPLSISIGCAVQQPDTPNWQTLLQQADQALYQAKAGGRNCVVFATPSELADAIACS
ncbi:GGDEF domain-containing protein [Alkalimonas sp. NCh-2]|uniref:GGDEF domain-containing protein n=1 Tax=Alkalimonas sp. NCh-2 TaxID=3144846 RepID=UPI0031F6DD99